MSMPMPITTIEALSLPDAVLLSIGLVILTLVVVTTARCVFMGKTFRVCIRKALRWRGRRSRR